MIFETVCRHCGHWKLTERHQCPPLFKCREAGGEGTWKNVHAYDAESAAERFAKRLDHQTVPSDHLIEVQASGSEETHLFDIIFDHAVSYHVSRPSPEHVFSG